MAASSYCWVLVHSAAVQIAASYMRSFPDCSWIRPKQSWAFRRPVAGKRPALALERWILNNDRHRLRVQPVDGVRPQQSPAEQRWNAEVVPAIRDQADDDHVLGDVMAGHGHRVVVDRHHAFDQAALAQLSDLVRVQVDQFDRARLCCVPTSA